MLMTIIIAVYALKLDNISGVHLGPHNKNGHLCDIS